MGAVDTSKEAVADPLLLRQPSLDREGPQAEPQLPAPGPRSAVLPGRGLGKGGRVEGEGLRAWLSSCKRVWRRGGPVLCLLGTSRGRRAALGRVLGTRWSAPSRKLQRRGTLWPPWTCETLTCC